MPASGKICFSPKFIVYVHDLQRKISFSLIYFYIFVQIRERSLPKEKFLKAKWSREGLKVIWIIFCPQVVIYSCTLRATVTVNYLSCVTGSYPSYPLEVSTDMKTPTAGFTGTDGTCPDSLMVRNSIWLLWENVIRKFSKLFSFDDFMLGNIMGNVHRWWGVFHFVCNIWQSYLLCHSHPWWPFTNNFVFVFLGTENPADDEHREQVAVEKETGGSYVVWAFPTHQRIPLLAPYLPMKWQWTAA